MGVHGKTVRDAVYALDAIYGVDQRDNYTLAQIGKVPADGFSSYLSNSTALKGAKFGIPWKSFWVLADLEQLGVLLKMADMVQQAGATIVNGTELPYYKDIVSPDGWNW